MITTATNTPIKIPTISPMWSAEGLAVVVVTFPEVIAAWRWHDLVFAKSTWSGV